MPPSLARQEPLCPVFGACGGCQYQDISYQDELALKAEVLRGFLAGHLPGVVVDILPVVPSPQITHYRNRLDLKLKRTRAGTVHIGFSPPDKGPVLEITACPIAMKAISDFIPRLKDEAVAALPPKYKMANLTVRCGDGPDVRWGGIGRRSTRLSTEEYFSTYWNGLEIFYSLDTFFQANLSILPKVLETIRSMPVWSPEGTFFDLYGGVGLFGLSVHDLVRRVINIEENVHSIKLAQYNVEKNHLRNVQIFSGRVEEILPPFLEKDFLGKNTMMVDPPRAGLSADSVTLLNGLKNIQHLIYLSCNPETLASNLRDLIAGGWQIISIQPFDFFPRTRHLETLVLLKKS